MNNEIATSSARSDLVNSDLFNQVMNPSGTGYLFLSLSNLTVRQAAAFRRVNRAAKDLVDSYIEDHNIFCLKTLFGRMISSKQICDLFSHKISGDSFSLIRKLREYRFVFNTGIEIFLKQCFYQFSFGEIKSKNIYGLRNEDVLKLFNKEYILRQLTYIAIEALYIRVIGVALGLVVSSLMIYSQKNALPNVWALVSRVWMGFFVLGVVLHACLPRVRRDRSKMILELIKFLKKIKLNDISKLANDVYKALLVKANPMFILNPLLTLNAIFCSMLIYEKKVAFRYFLGIALCATILSFLVEACYSSQDAS